MSCQACLLFLKCCHSPTFKNQCMNGSALCVHAKQKLFVLDLLDHSASLSKPAKTHAV